MRGGVRPLGVLPYEQNRHTEAFRLRLDARR